MITTGCIAREASVDEVFEIVSAFAPCILGESVSNECYAEHKGAYVHVFIGGHPADGFSDDYALARAAEIGERVAPLGWFVAKAQLDRHDSHDAEEHPDEEPQTMCFVDVFPTEGRGHEGDETVFWHASPASNRASILKGGLRPATCGNDHIELPVERLYVCTHAMFLDQIEIDMSRSRGWRGLDLWRIDLSAIPHHHWREDVEMEGVSAWTDQAIPAAALSLSGRLENMHSFGWMSLLEKTDA